MIPPMIPAPRVIQPLRFASWEIEPPDHNDPEQDGLHNIDNLEIMRGRFNHFSRLLSSLNAVTLVSHHKKRIDDGIPVDIKLGDGPTYTFNVTKRLQEGSLQETYQLTRKPEYPAWHRWLPAFLRQIVQANQKEALVMQDTDDYPNNQVELRVVYGFHDARFWNDSADKNFPRPAFLELAQNAFYRLEVLVEQALERANPEGTP